MRLILISVLFITGCASPAYQQHPKIVFSPESVQRPEYNRDFIACDKIAKGLQTDTTSNAAAGAATGAGVAALTGLVMGVHGGYGRLAGVGALAGGLGAAGGSAAYNMTSYKAAFVQCMRDRDYQVY